MMPRFLKKQTSPRLQEEETIGRSEVLNILPDSVIEDIVSNLPLNDLASFSKTCRRIHKICCLDSRNVHLLLLHPPPPSATASRAFGPRFIPIQAPAGVPRGVDVVNDSTSSKKLIIKQLGEVPLCPFSDTLAQQLHSLERIPSGKRLFSGFISIGRKKKQQQTTTMEIWLASDFISDSHQIDCIALEKLSNPQKIIVISVIVGQTLEGLCCLDNSGISLDLRLKLAHVYISKKSGGLLIMPTRGLVHLIKSIKDSKESKETNNIIIDDPWIAPEMKNSNNNNKQTRLYSRFKTSKWDVWSLGVMVIELLTGGTSQVLNCCRNVNNSVNVGECYSIIRSRLLGIIENLESFNEYKNVLIEFVSLCLCVDPNNRLTATELIHSQPSLLRLRPKDSQSELSILEKL